MEYEVQNFLAKTQFVYHLDGGNASAVGDFIAEAAKGGNVVCFSGSRPAALPWKYNEDCELCQRFKASLKELLVGLISHGFNHFISGMALGLDTIAAELVLELKEEYDITLEAAIPFERQAARWNWQQRERYDAILKRADKVTYVSRDYSSFCYAVRNEYMVKSAALLVAYPNQSDGGTVATINIAKRLKKNIIILK